jgi:hypothetical protein
MQELKERERSFGDRSGWNWLTVMLVAGFDISDDEFSGAVITVVLRASSYKEPADKPCSEPVKSSPHAASLTYIST